MSSKAKKLVLGSGLGIINFFATTLVSLFMFPFLISHLGDRMYGLWLLLGSFFAYYGMFDFGLGSAVQRYLSRALGTDDYEEANRVFNSSLLVFGIIGVAAFLFSLCAAFAGTLFFNDPVELRLFRWIVVLVGTGLSLSFPMRSFWAIFASHIRFDFNNYIALAILVVRTSSIVFFLSRGHGLLVFAVIMVFTDVAGYFTSALLSLKLAPYIKFSRDYVRKAQVKKLFNYSIFSFISRVADSIKFSIDNFVIVGFIGLGSVTLYSIATRLMSYYMHFMTSAVGIVTPVFSGFEGQNNYEEIRSKFKFITKISGYTACLIGGLLVIFGKPFIQRWVGEEYIYGYWLMLILVFPVLLDLMQSPSGQVLYGISKHRFLSLINVGEALFNLALSLILVRFYGLAGVAMGTAIPLVIKKGLLQPVYVCKKLEIPCMEYYLMIVRIMAVSLLIFLLEESIMGGIIKPDYLNMLALASLNGAIFIVSVFFAGFDRVEREYLIEVSGRILPVKKINKG